MTREPTSSLRRLLSVYRDSYWPVVLMLPLVVGVLLSGLSGVALYVALGLAVVVGIVASSVGPLSSDRLFGRPDEDRTSARDRRRSD